MIYRGQVTEERW